MLASALLDLKVAWRQSIAQPAISLAALTTLAVGFGATTALFAAVHAWLVAPLPFPRADRLTMVWETIPSAGIDQNTPAPATLQMWRERNRSYEALAAWTTATFALTGTGDPARIEGARVSANLLDVLGVLPETGRAFSPADDRPGVPRVALVSAELWARQFGRDRSVVGRVLVLDGGPVEVAGVLPDSVRHLGLDADVWVPFAMTEEERTSGNRMLWVLGRLRAGVSPADAAREMHALMQEASQGSLGATVIGLREQAVGTLGRDVRILLAATVCVLLIACANVASLSLARVTARGGELAVRTALGASRARLARQVFTESLALGLAGALAGVILAAWAVRAFTAMLPETRHLTAIDVSRGMVLLFALAAAVLAAVLCAAAPALQLSRRSLAAVVREHGRTATAGRRRLMHAFVAGEIAFALALVSSAALVCRSYANLQQVPLGFEHRARLAVEIPRPATESGSRSIQFYGALLERLEASPEIASAGLSQALPIRSSCCGASFPVEAPPTDTASILAYWRTVSPGYFEAMGIPVVAGRAFTRSDRDGAPLVAIVSASYAERAWPGQPAVGRRIGWSSLSRPLTVVGVAGDVRVSPVRQPGPHVYMPFAQIENRMPTGLVVSYRTSSAAALAAVRSAVSSLDPAQPVADVATMEDVVRRALGRRRFQLALVSIFAGVAALLALVGIYGLLTFTVSQSVREIGIRLALGATPRAVVRAVIARGSVLVFAGTLAGLGLAAWSGQFVRAFLFGIEPRDPLTIAGVGLAVMLAGVVTCALPAWRASRVDPAVALRLE